MFFRTKSAIARRLVQAQWGLVNGLDLAIGDDQQDADARQLLQEVLRRAKFQVRSPQQWAELFAQSLVRTVISLQNEAASASRTARDATLKYTSLQAEYDSLRTSTRRNSNQRRELIMTLLNERDQARDEVAQTRATLSHVQQMNDAEVKRLQGEVADLGRIVVEQRMQLDS